jgi:hypothetical protein
MKKIKFILMFAAIAISFSTMAQFTYGPRLGLNIANFGGDDTDDTKSLIGFNLGLMGNYAINDMFSLQAELLYDTKGAKYEGEDENGDTQTMPASLGYINIPIMAKATFGDEIKFFGQVGPTIGLLMSAKFDGESEYTTYEYDPNNPWSPPTEKKVKFKDDFKGTDFGLVFGGGAILPVGGMNLMVDLRYNMSLGTIHNATDGAEEADIKNGVFSINFGLFFGGE